MKKTLFKKTLAGIMSAALLFTAMSGMMTSAATSNGTMTVDTVSKAYSAGATVDVPVAVTAEEGVNTVRAEITYPANLVLTDVNVDTASAATVNVESNFKFELVNEPDYEPGKLIILAEVDNQLPNSLGFGFVLTFEVPEDEGDYDITLANITGAKYETEDSVIFALTNGKVTVTSGQEPIYEDPTLRLSSVTCTLENGFALNFGVTKTVLAAGWSNPYVVFKKALYDVNGDIAGYKESTVTFEQSYSNATHVYFTLPGVYPQELGSSINATIYATKDGHLYTGYTTLNYSVLTFATNGIKNVNKEAKEKAVLANMIFYGYETQLYAKYNLANPIVDVATTLVGNDSWKSYATTQLRTLTSVRANVDLDGATARIRSAGLVLEDKVLFNFRIAQAASDILLTNPSDYYLEFSYTDNYGNAKSYDLDIDPATGRVYCDKLIATEMSTTIVIVVKAHSDGREVSNKFTYSIESFISLNTNPDLNNLVASIIKYGDSVKAFAGIQ